MRVFSSLVLASALLAAAPLPAQELAETCRASSSYDLTLRADSLLFERAEPAPRRVEIGNGQLRTDGVPVTLRADEQDRLSLFERELRALAPRVRQVAENGVELAVQTLREQAAGMGMSAVTRAEFDQRLTVRAAELKQRIASSQSTRDWQGDVATRYGQEIAADLLPLLAGDIGQQALNAALAGDLQTAASLRDRATHLATTLEPALRQRMRELRPQIQALCPAIERLADLQEGLRGANGQPLGLLHVGS